MTVFASCFTRLDPVHWGSDTTPAPQYLAVAHLQRTLRTSRKSIAELPMYIQPRVVDISIERDTSPFQSARQCLTRPRTSAVSQAVLSCRKPSRRLCVPNTSYAARPLMNRWNTHSLPGLTCVESRQLQHHGKTRLFRGGGASGEQGKTRVA